MMGLEFGQTFIIIIFFSTMDFTITKDIFSFLKNITLVTPFISYYTIITYILQFASLLIVICIIYNENATFLTIVKLTSNSIFFFFSCVRGLLIDIVICS